MAYLKKGANRWVNLSFIILVHVKNSFLLMVQAGKSF
ncbi:hypothetical protein PaelaDRAFT_3947 [Paenibacillus lactis 154]|uniref:Uncharacterized protein n=1 Tax=Paenibacillus lactis 154 TaxID=743719 RepID=G4HIY6_9BACL|nr:hypothetical protein PaelaDRAFT_3947 [Paenibacillus lactis 154]